MIKGVIYTKAVPGDVYGRLTVCSDLGMIDALHMVLAKCVCGMVKSYQLSSLKKGTTISCGCYRNYLISERRKTHGLTKHPLYRVWIGMRKRCYYDKLPDFKHWGGRGITVCDEWRDSFVTFYEWAISNGWKPGLHIDRHPDNNGNYEPSNCRFVTPTKNQRNKRNNFNFSYNGQTKTVSEWCELYNLDNATLAARIKNGWPLEKIFIRPNKLNRIS